MEVVVGPLELALAGNELREVAGQERALETRRLDPPAVPAGPIDRRRQLLLEERNRGEGDDVGAAAGDPLADLLHAPQPARERDLSRDRLASLYPGAAPDDVFLFSSGMGAISAVYRVLTALRPGEPTAQVEFPYLDSFKIQDQFGSGVIDLTVTESGGVAEFDLEIVDDRLYLYSDGSRPLSSVDPAMWEWVFTTVDVLNAKLDRWERWRDERLAAPNDDASPSTTSPAPAIPRGVAPEGRRLKDRIPVLAVVPIVVMVGIWFVIPLLESLTGTG